ncbi:MAG: YitT family protein [Clostridia bacterium]|nr:YitT family protein [Clostridia bacterium]
MKTSKKNVDPKVPFNPFDPNFDLKQDFITFVLIVVSCFLQSLVISAFYTPNHFLSGGVTGIAMLVEYVTGLPRFVPLILLNLPLVVIGFKYMNAKFIIFSAMATLLYSLFFSIPFVANFRIDLGENSEMLSAVVGAALMGIIGVPVVKRGATLGGMDVLSVILSRRFSIQIGTFNIAYNLIIMTVLGFFFGVRPALFSMLATFVSNTAFNYGMQGLNRNVTVFIISKKWDEIAPHVMSDMNRGVTFLHGEGAYTGEQREIVYCIIKTTELGKLKAIVRKHDTKALFSIVETKEVVGRGFAAMN